MITAGEQGAEVSELHVESPFMGEDMAAIMVISFDNKYVIQSSGKAMMIQQHYTL